MCGVGRDQREDFFGHSCGKSSNVFPPVPGTGRGLLSPHHSRWGGFKRPTQECCTQPLKPEEWLCLAMLKGVKDERLGRGWQAAALLLPMKGQRVVLQQICLMVGFRLSNPVQEGLSPDGGERGTRAVPWDAVRWGVSANLESPRSP